MLNREFLQTHSYIAIGEQHGTNEMPKVFGTIVGAALNELSKISVFLEFTSDLNPIFGLSKRDFLEKLAASPIFELEGFDDGRISQSMITLLTELNDLKCQNPNKLSIRCMDVPLAERYELDHEEYMFSQVTSSKLIGTGLIFAGNVHAQTREDKECPPPYYPLGRKLKDHDKSTTSVLLAHDGGTIRCISGTPDNPNFETRVEEANRMCFANSTVGELNPLANEYPWDYELNVGKISASPKMEFKQKQGLKR